MSETKHTPGPWRWRMHGASGDTKLVGSNEVPLVWQDRHWQCPSQDANAALIAAAPDLLAACEKYIELEDWQDDDPRGAVTDVDYAEVAEMLRAAIAKARKAQQ